MELVPAGAVEDREQVAATLLVDSARTPSETRTLVVSAVSAHLCQTQTCRFVLL